MFPQGITQDPANHRHQPDLTRNLQATETAEPVPSVTKIEQIETTILEIPTIRGMCCP